MESIKTEFKEFCDSLSSTKENSDKIYKFYKSLKVAASSQDKFMSLTERRKKSLEFLTNSYGEHYVIEGINLYEKKVASGEATTNTIPYFNKVVENLSKNNNISYRPSSVFSEPMKVSTPKKKHKYTSEYDDDIYNWMYTCSNCNTEFDAWANECPKCKLRIEWSSI